MQDDSTTMEASQTLDKTFMSCDVLLIYHKNTSCLAAFQQKSLSDVFSFAGCLATNL